MQLPPTDRPPRACDHDLLAPPVCPPPSVYTSCSVIESYSKSYVRFIIRVPDWSYRRHALSIYTQRSTRVSFHGSIFRSPPHACRRCHCSVEGRVLRWRWWRHVGAVHTRQWLPCRRRWCSRRKLRQEAASTCPRRRRRRATRRKGWQAAEFGRWRHDLRVKARCQRDQYVSSA